VVQLKTRPVDGYVHQLDGAQRRFKAVRRQLADINWQRIPQCDCTAKESLAVHACVALDLSIPGFKCFDVDHSRVKIG